MLEMILYGIAVMFSPGPLNILGLNQGLNKKTVSSIGFFSGIGSSMFILLIIFGYTGEKVIKKEYLFYISLIGGFYMLYLAYKVFTSKIEITTEEKLKGLTFKDGLLMQFFNPKATLAALPIATINFPANNITGIKILFISLILSFLSFSAPMSYSLIGGVFNKVISNNNFINTFNKIMSILLILVAISILKDHVVLVFFGINEY